MIIKSKERFPNIDVELVDILKYGNEKNMIMFQWNLTYKSQHFLKLFVEKSFTLLNNGIAF